MTENGPISDLLTECDGSWVRNNSLLRIGRLTFQTWVDRPETQRHMA